MSLMQGEGRRKVRRWLARGRHDGLGDLDLELEKDATWSTDVGRAGVEVRCARGLVMVTSEGDIEDHVLSAGHTFVARQRGRLAIWALQPTRVRVKQCSEASETGMEIEITA